ncbi:MAG: signal peptide peptidase SppA [Sphingobacteriales bacterium]|nr:signal peptide peptidase SppA [Sphingobacteriales bacterium]MBP9141937.1 signal peptide peptidase SppA [Chitinophagales bacterium]MDA0199762.1 signal peptide peptidase SppA [Bacteroidota bacterium]MBK6888544.1 signal peptide peptidase SppA [Sphingobacteriales bacterium]MBK7528948.1 signal peptide peptidase SppA [Sphingobacteriales bacterium]
MSFFKTTLATVLGIFLFFALLFVLFMVFGLAASVSSTSPIAENSILKLKLDNPIPDKSKPEDLEIGSLGQFSFAQTIGLADMINTIEHAATDNRIKGIYLELSSTPSGFANLKSLRDALANFKTSGKFIVAYGETMTQGAYFIASVADKIYLNPTGLVLLKGFSTEIPFFKNTLDKLGVEPEIFYAGNFKSATEPFRLTKMSDYNRIQTRELINGFQNIYIETVASARKMSPQQLTQIIDNLTVRKAEDAKQSGVIDELAYYDGVLNDLEARIGIAKDSKEKVKFANITTYFEDVKGDFQKLTKDKIAVVYAEGSIVDGLGESGEVASEPFSKMFRRIREDEQIKAVVLRVNSPGGSALASDIMWRELKLIKEKGKPIIVSMGDVAASGGYYISCIADTIVAMPNTITGSIGVFGMMAELDNFYADKLGISYDTVKTTKFSDFPMSAIVNRDLRDEEKIIIQQSVDQIYDTFLQRVAEGRGMTRDAVHQVAQGRVWTGEQAKQKGLVDVLGNLDDAIRIAATKANIADKYYVRYYPTDKDFATRIMEQITGKETKQNIIKKELGPFYASYQQLKAITQMRGPQMRLPFVYNFE